MKRGPRVVAGVGLALVAVVLLFPPFMVIDRSAPETRHTGALGYHPFWRPPTAEMAEQVLVRELGPAPDGSRTSLHVAVNQVLLVIETAGVVVGTLAVYLMVRCR